MERIALLSHRLSTRLNTPAWRQRTVLVGGYLLAVVFTALLVWSLWSQLSPDYYQLHLKSCSLRLSQAVYENMYFPNAPALADPCAYQAQLQVDRLYDYLYITGAAIANFVYGCLIYLANRTVPQWLNYTAGDTRNSGAAFVVYSLTGLVITGSFLTVIIVQSFSMVPLY